MSDSRSNPIRRTSVKLRLENFRLFRDSGWFRLAPLTCLVGRNSSGKSSVISAILLLKQSMEQELVGAVVTPLTLTGPYCDLGNFSDVVHNHDVSSEMSLSFLVSLSELGEFFKNRYRSPEVEIALPRRQTFPRFSYLSRWAETPIPSRGEFQVRLTFSSDEPFGPSLCRIEFHGAVGSATFVRTIRGRRQQHWRLYTATLPSRSIALRAWTRTFFPRIDIRNSAYSRMSDQERRKVRVFVSACQQFFHFLQRTLADSEMIGPFRTPPERRYAFGGFNSSGGGPSGENAINILITESLLRPKGARPLHTAVSYWIRRLKLAKSLKVRDIAKRLNLFQVDIGGISRSTKVNLADVGFGVSQVLPVIVQGLLMRPGGVFLVQQPEIHLHPDAQAGLADFFIHLSSKGVITVIETHSEYLLLRLRRRLAENFSRRKKRGSSASSFEMDDVAVLFTGPDSKNPGVQQLEIGSSFQFENLPSGFMTQALEDRVALLAALRRKGNG